jgi:hypothetical protein
VSLPTQVFVAQQRFSLDLTIKFKTASTIAASISCKLRQYYQGQVQLPHYGTVRRHFHRDIMYRSISIPPSAATANNRIHLSEVSVTMPSNWVLPCFTSNHMRMYYTLVIVVSSREPGFFGAVNQGEVEIPIGMANLEENQWGRVYDIQDRQQSTDAPFFFDPSLSEPANEQEADLIQVDTTGASNHGTDDDTEEEGNNSRLSPPPSYASLQQQYRQRQARRSKKRVEKTRYSSHWVKPGMMPELGEALTVILEDLNEEHQATSGI